MTEPGKTTTEEGEYRKYDEAHRQNWENGQNGDLTGDQQTKLGEQAEGAARFSGTPGTYGADYPRKQSGEIDHGQLIANVKKYVGKGYPNNDNPNVPSPDRSLGHMIEVGGTPEKPKTPPDAEPPPVGTSSGEPEWVCHNVAMYTAALLRKLGYAVREVNMYLSQKGEYNYQSAALQVWFEGKWHFVDPFTCNYDPKASADVFHGYTDLRTVYWDGTTPVRRSDWGVYRDDPPPPPWKKLPDDQIGNDLQKRFYPKSLDDHGRLIVPEERFRTLFGGAFQTRVASEATQGEAEKSGIAITAKTPGVRLYLMDGQGRVTDGELQQIPGAFHIAAGTPIMDDPSGPIADPGQPPRDKPQLHDEWVFFGTAKYSAEFDEIGTHELSLFVLGGGNQSAKLEVERLGDIYPVSFEGVPEEIQLAEGLAVVPFTVTIDPIDPAFHALFNLLMVNGVLDKAAYWPAADAVHAMMQRRREWARLRRGPGRKGLVDGDIN
jgi:hypothetical protein